MSIAPWTKATGLRSALSPNLKTRKAPTASASSCTAAPSTSLFLPRSRSQKSEIRGQKSEPENFDYAYSICKGVGGLPQGLSARHADLSGEPALPHGGAIRAHESDSAFIPISMHKSP